MTTVKTDLKELFDKNTLLHLRLPFSLFLLPVFCFALSQCSGIHVFNAIVTGIVLHFLIYPSSNAYNSFMDEDKGSIGSLKNPPPVTRKLYYVSIVFDIAGLTCAALIGWQAILLLIPYIAASKIYSWKRTRLKKYPLKGWLLVILFQGAYTYMFVHMCCSDNFSLHWFTPQNIEAMLLATLLIGGYYPLTQIYQHEEDKERGDITISYTLGIRGTFLFTAIIFSVSCITAYHYFISYYTINHFFIFMICLLPVIFYFLNWWRFCVKNETQADFSHTMRITALSSGCLIICYCILMFLNNN